MSFAKGQVADHPVWPPRPLGSKSCSCDVESDSGCDGPVPRASTGAQAGAPAVDVAEARAVKDTIHGQHGRHAELRAVSGHYRRQEVVNGLPGRAGGLEKGANPRSGADPTYLHRGTVFVAGSSPRYYTGKTLGLKLSY